MVSTLAGSKKQGRTDGVGTAASFNMPPEASMSPIQATTSLRRISSDGEVTTLAGSGRQGHADGAGAAASFSFPSGIAVDSTGTFYVTDHNNLIRKVSSGGEVTTFAGSAVSGRADGKGTSASFSGPEGSAVDSSGSSLGSWSPQTSTLPSVS